MGKRRHSNYDEDRIKKKIRKLEDRLRILNADEESQTTRGLSPGSSPPRDPPPRDSPPREVPAGGDRPETENTTDIDELPEEFLMALGTEGQDKKELGPNIRQELVTRWTVIMAEGLDKEAKEALVNKYPRPENFPAAIAPILNLEIAAALSEISIRRDKRIIHRQNMIGTIMGCLGKTLTAIFKGELNTKRLIEEINDAAKIAAEMYYQESESRRFFALAGTSKAVQDAIKSVKPDTFLFGKDCAEKIATAQKVQKTSAQLRAPEKTVNKKPQTKKQVNWKSPLRQQRGRSGLQHQRQFSSNKQYQHKGTNYSHNRQKQQRRTPPKSRSRYHR